MDWSNIASIFCAAFGGAGSAYILDMLNTWRINKNIEKLSLAKAKWILQAYLDNIKVINIMIENNKKDPRINCLEMTGIQIDKVVGSVDLEGLNLNRAFSAPNVRYDFPDLSSNLDELTFLLKNNEGLLNKIKSCFDSNIEMINRINDVARSTRSINFDKNMFFDHPRGEELQIMNIESFVNYSLLMLDKIAETEKLIRSAIYEISESGKKGQNGASLK